MKALLRKRRQTELRRTDDAGDRILPSKDGTSTTLVELFDLWIPRPRGRHEAQHEELRRVRQVASIDLLRSSCKQQCVDEPGAQSQIGSERIALSAHAVAGRTGEYI